MEKEFVKIEKELITLSNDRHIDKLELIFNIGGSICPISALIGVGVGVYSKKLAQDNMNILVNSLNSLILDRNIMLKKIYQLEKENVQLNENIKEYKNRILEIENDVVNSKEIFECIKNKTQQELRDFSFNLQDMVNATIQEKSVDKINKYAEYITDTILDDLIFTPNDSFKYILNVINSLNENDKYVLKVFNEKSNVDDWLFDNKDKSYSIESDDRLSIQKLLKLGLIEFKTELYVPPKDLMHEGMTVSIDKTYYATDFFYEIRRYLKLYE